jgi:hypothetical protein
MRIKENITFKVTCAKADKFLAFDGKLGGLLVDGE